MARNKTGFWNLAPKTGPITTIVPQHWKSTSKSVLIIRRISVDSPQLHWSTQTDASAVMACHRVLPSALRSSDNSVWSVHSLMSSSIVYAVFICDDHLQPFPVDLLWFYGSISCRQIWPNHHILRCLARRSYDLLMSDKDINLVSPVATCSRLSGFHGAMKHPPAALAFS